MDKFEIALDANDEESIGRNKIIIETKIDLVDVFRGFGMPPVEALNLIGSLSLKEVPRVLGREVGVLKMRWFAGATHLPGQRIKLFSDKLTMILKNFYYINKPVIEKGFKSQWQDWELVIDHFVSLFERPIEVQEVSFKSVQGSGPGDDYMIAVVSCGVPYGSYSDLTRFFGISERDFLSKDVYNFFVAHPNIPHSLFIEGEKDRYDWDKLKVRSFLNTKSNVLLDYLRGSESLIDITDIEKGKDLVRWHLEHLEERNSNLSLIDKSFRFFRKLMP